VNTGRLVAFEGIDGCGKSTQIARLARALRDRDPLCTHEPTDGPHGRRIRAMARSGASVAPKDELAWFLDDRREHVSRVIAPALAAGRLVLTDRYFLSTVAYQGARGLDWHEILEQSEAEFPIPDRVLLLEIPAEAGLARTHTRGRPAEPSFEDVGRLRRAAAIFAEIDRPYLRRIDAARDPDAVFADVEAAVRELLDGA
jgi:dTMP kinase